jgi:DNA polymerase-3 subunit epsilon
VRWTDIPIHVIDFEGSLRTGVVEYGVVTLLEGRLVAVHTRLCRPAARIAADETRIHGLSDADLADAEGFAAEWGRFAGLRETGLLGAHFSAMENSLLRSVWPCPRLSPDFLSPGGTMAEWGPWIDTGCLARSALGREQPAGLEEVVVALGLEESLRDVAERYCPGPRRQFHCAAFDALACALVLQKLARDSDGALWSLARLAAESTANLRRRRERQQTRLF